MTTKRRRGRPPTVKEGVNLFVWVPLEWIEEMDLLKKIAGEDNRSVVVRAALRKGLDAMQAVVGKGGK